MAKIYSYISKDWNVIPIKHKSKVTYLSKWNRYCREKIDCLDNAELQYDQFAICLGPYNQLCALDLDFDVNRELYPKTKIGLINELIILIEDTLNKKFVAKRGRRGFTVFFRAEKEATKNKVILNNKDNLHIGEYLLDNTYTVLPPSIHPETNKPYVWIKKNTLLNTTLYELPMLNYELKTNLKSIINYFLDENDLGPLLDKPLIKQTNSLIYDASHQISSQVYSKLLSLLKPWNHSGDEWLKIIAGLSRSTLNIDRANQIFDEWASQDKRENKYDSKKNLKQWNWARTNNALLKYDILSVVKIANRYGFKDDIQIPNKSVMKNLISMSGLNIGKYKKLRANYLVDEYIHDETLVLIHGFTGVGKSTYALHLAAGISSGIKIGPLDCQKRKCLYIDGEMGPTLIASILGQYFPDKDLDNLHLLSRGSYPDFSVDFNDDIFLEHLEALIQDGEFKVLFLDNLSSLVQSSKYSESDHLRFDKLLNWLLKIKAKYKITIIILHHDNKTGSVRGACNLLDKMDLVFQISKSAYGKSNTQCEKDLNFYIDCKKKRCETTKLHHLMFVCLTKDGGKSKLKFKIDVNV